MPALTRRCLALVLLVSPSLSSCKKAEPEALQTPPPISTDAGVHVVAPRDHQQFVLDGGSPLDATSAVFSTVDPLTQDVAGPGPLLTASEYCAALAELEAPWCDYLDDCCTIADRSSNNFHPSGCANQAALVLDCETEIQTLTASGVIFDGSWASECVRGLQGQEQWPPPGCSGDGARLNYYRGHSQIPRQQIEGCRRLLRGSLEANASCSTVEQCQVGLTCVSVPLGSGQPGLCQAPIPAGAPCGTTSDCELGLFCVNDSVVQTCGPLRQAGQTCLSASDCMDGLSCASNTCFGPAAAGALCVVDAHCEHGLTCVASLCTATAGTGTACTSDIDCLGRCDLTLGRCVDLCLGG